MMAIKRNLLKRHLLDILSRDSGGPSVPKQKSGLFASVMLFQLHNLETVNKDLTMATLLM